MTLWLLVPLCVLAYLALVVLVGKLLKARAR